MLCQVTAYTATTKTLNKEYQYELSQPGGHTIPTWFLLDNQSTVDVLSNRRLLKNIRISGREMVIFSTGGQRTTNIFGDLPGYEMVWLHPVGIANILSLSNVAEKYHLT